MEKMLWEMTPMMFPLQVILILLLAMLVCHYCHISINSYTSNTNFAFRTLKGSGRRRC